MGHHERFAPTRGGVAPGGEDLIGQGGFVADVDAAGVEVEPECFGLTRADGEGGFGFAGGGEAHHFAQCQRSHVGRDVLQNAASGGRGELLIVADEAHLRAPAGEVLNGGGEVLGACHPGLVDDDHRVRVDGVHPCRRGSCAAADVPHELVEGVG